MLAQLRTGAQPAALLLLLKMPAASFQFSYIQLVPRTESRGPLFTRCNLVSQSVRQVTTEMESPSDQTLVDIS